MALSVVVAAAAGWMASMLAVGRNGLVMVPVASWLLTIVVFSIAAVSSKQARL